MHYKTPFAIMLDVVKVSDWTLCNFNQQITLFKLMFYFSSSGLLHVSNIFMFFISKTILYVHYLYINYKLDALINIYS